MRTNSQKTSYEASEIVNLTSKGRLQISSLPFLFRWIYKFISWIFEFDSMRQCSIPIFPYEFLYPKKIFSFFILFGSIFVYELMQIKFACD